MYFVDVYLSSFCFFFFFLNAPAPPDFSPFPHPAPFLFFPPSEPYLSRWPRVIDGQPLPPPRGELLPVRRGGAPAMLKIALAPEEVAGARLMAWWNGDGASPVLAQEGPALLMLRATGPESLVEMARGARDEEIGRAHV